MPPEVSIKYKPNKSKYWDVWYTCSYTCKTMLTFSAQVEPATHIAPVKEFAKKHPKCPECGKRMNYYWTGQWTTDPRLK